MAEKRYYWLKFKKDFFRSLRIKRLRRLAGGDTFTIIYLKLQLLALSTEGRLEYKGVFESFEEEMAEEIDEDVENVGITVRFLISCGLMEQNADEYFLPYVAENTGSETESAERVRKHREQKALHCNTDVTELLRACNTEKEIDKEKEKDKELEIEIEGDTKANNSPRTDYQKIIDLFHTYCPSYSKVTRLSEQRKKAIRARLNKYTEDDFINAFEKAEESDFLKGSNNRNWSANFDWIINDTNMAKILDGNYDNKGPRKQEGGKSIIDEWMNA